LITLTPVNQGSQTTSTDFCNKIGHQRTDALQHDRRGANRKTASRLSLRKTDQAFVSRLQWKIAFSSRDKQRARAEKASEQHSQVDGKGVGDGFIAKLSEPPSGESLMLPNSL
jgi:hypothetical protein